MVVVIGGSGSGWLDDGVPLMSWSFYRECVVLPVDFWCLYFPPPLVALSFVLPPFLWIEFFCCSISSSRSVLLWSGVLFLQRRCGVGYLMAEAMV